MAGRVMTLSAAVRNYTYPSTEEKSDTELSIKLEGSQSVAYWPHTSLPVVLNAWSLWHQLFLLLASWSSIGIAGPLRTTMPRVPLVTPASDIQ